MAARTDLIRSSLRQLIEEQARVTKLYEHWYSITSVRSHDVLGPAVGNVLRQLRRDLDRLFLLQKSYDVDGEASCHPEPDSENELTHADGPASSGRGALASPMPEFVQILQQGYWQLEELSLRYASVYCVATTLSEPPIASIVSSNLRDLRKLVRELVGVLPFLTIQNLATKYPTLLLDRTAGPRVRHLLHRIWAANPDRAPIPPSSRE